MKRSHLSENLCCWGFLLNFKKLAKFKTNIKVCKNVGEGFRFITKLGVFCWVLFLFGWGFFTNTQYCAGLLAVPAYIPSGHGYSSRWRRLGRGLQHQPVADSHPCSLSCSWPGFWPVAGVAAAEGGKKLCRHELWPSTLPQSQKTLLFTY